MKGNELRIGNITDRGTVVSFYESGIHIGFGKTYKFKEVEPIPLNIEWLIRFGFIKAKYWDGAIIKLKHGGKLECRNYKGKWLTSLRYGDNASSYISLKPCEYIHQIQNLVYEIDGQELKITEQ